MTNDEEVVGYPDDVRALGEDNDFELTLCNLLKQAFSQNGVKRKIPPQERYIFR